MGEVPFARIFDHQFFLIMSSGNLPEDQNVGKGQRPGLTYVQVTAQHQFEIDHWAGFGWWVSDCEQNQV